MATLRILHTSDWHLGKPLKDVDRTADYSAFLRWLLDEIVVRRPDVLLIAGDVFDTSMPATDAQRLYYDFLRRAAQTPLKAVVVTAGNHDSQRFLSAPAPLLETLRCRIVSEDPDEQALLLRDDAGRPILAVAAVPYLRDGDVRLGEVGQDEGACAAAWQRGVAARYARVREALDRAMRAEGLSREDVPVAAMGHLFVAGSAMRPNAEAADSIYVGSLRSVPASAFGEDWDYVALGHIHNAQRVKSASAPAYYCGSPLALSFKHRGYRHQILQVDFDTAKPLGERAAVTIVPVPQPRFVGTVTGDAASLPERFREIAQAEGGPGKGAPLLEAYVSGEVGDARAVDEALRRAAAEADVVLCAVRAQSAVRAEEEDQAMRRIEDVTPEEVFAEILARERAAMRSTLAQDCRRRLSQEREAQLLAAWEAQKAQLEAAESFGTAQLPPPPKLTSENLADIEREAERWANAETDARIDALVPLFAQAQAEAVQAIEKRRAARSALLDEGSPTTPSEEDDRKSKSVRPEETP